MLIFLKFQTEPFSLTRSWFGDNVANKSSLTLELVLPQTLTLKVADTPIKSPYRLYKCSDVTPGKLCTALQANQNFNSSVLQQKLIELLIGKFPSMIIVPFMGTALMTRDDVSTAIYVYQNSLAL